MSVTYEAALEVSEGTARFLSALLHAERVRGGTRRGTLSTAYAYPREGIAVLAVLRPSLHGALLAANVAGHMHVGVNRTLIPTDLFHAPGPAPGEWTPGGVASTSGTSGTARSCPL